ncbi:ankyrin repeat domain-containing protein [Muricauda sp. SCSIO 64092]|uniref:ankyrin repeat domain-containing protein n=1 Tax=Allomuricauda sp. SCSIO 64092 TaxID=2908842 RepID=UPI001FF33018|nr:ankyrin repeat domain-containing protein [Muricauda sp. SCSIO 64092]UOY06137.1 ankyrin repeat domain-containing protein [Muricauda sp. SCSIO 64092]
MVFLVKASVVILILWLFYKLLLERESFFAVNRMYLLVGLLMVFLLPFIALPELVNHQGVVGNWLEQTPFPEPQESFVSSAESEPENIRSTDYAMSQDNDPTNVPPTTGKSIGFWLFAIYVFGVIVLAAHLLFQLATVFFQVQRTVDKVDDVHCTIVNVDDDSGPRSFFNYILLNPRKYNSETYEQILEHEKIHVKLMHSIDLFIAEIAIIVLWFNPIVWLFKKDIEKNIEYQTDALLLKSPAVETEKYQLNLIEIAVERKPLTIVSNYNQSLIKKRIVMMNKKKSNTHSYWKYAFIAPTLVVTLLLLNQPLSVKAQEKVVSIGEHNTGERFENEYDDDVDRELAPLLYAVRSGDLKQVKKLVAEGADVNLVQGGEGTALVMAIRKNKLQIARFLMEKGADPNLGTDNDGHPLWLAARNGDIELVKLLVAKGVDVNKKFPGDGSALIQASKNGDLAMAKALVRLKADINMGVHGDGNPLIMASKGGHFELVEYLVGLGAAINQEVKGDETPLINASEQGHLAIVKFLVEKGADVNKICTERLRDGNIRVRTALLMADKKGHDSIVKYLKSKSAKDN